MSFSPIPGDRSLLTKIVGWSLRPTLDTTYPLEALHMALSMLPEDDAPYHSNRSCQYCSHTYVVTLKSRRIQISMTQCGDLLENAVAERANGILKTEWLCHMVIPDGKKYRTEVQHIIGSYNDERPHISIGYQTLSEAQGQTDYRKRCQKNSREKPPD